MKISSFLKVSAAIILSMLLVIALNMISINKSFETLNEVKEKQVEFIKYGQELVDASDYLTNKVRSYVQFGDKVHYDDYWKEVKETKTREKVVEKLKELGALPEELALIEKSQQNSDVLVETENRAMKAVEAGDFELGRKLVFESNYDSNKAIIMAPVEEFREILSSRVAEEVSKAESNVKRDLIVMTLLIILLGVLIIWVFLFIAKKVGSLKRVGDILKELENSGGDLTARVTVSGRDEIGMISSSFNKVLETLQNIMISIKMESESVNLAVDTISKDMFKLDENIEEISSTTEEMSAGMEETAAASDEMDSVSKRIEDAVESIATRAQEGAVSAGEIKERANDLKVTVVRSQRKAIELYENTRENLLSAIEESKAVDKIGELSHAIMNITEETNLLALNSAIEAARAGEAGKGFAVVAGEIKKLAEESKATAIEIQNITQTVVSSVQNLANSSQHILEFVNNQVVPDYEMLVDTGNKYSGDAEMVEDLVSELSTTSEELQQSINVMIRSIAEVAKATNESALGITDIAGSSGSMLNMSKNMVDQVTKSKESVGLLTDKVSGFKV